MINLDYYRPVTKEEMDKYQKPDCAVYIRGKRDVQRVCNDGEWSSYADVIYYVPLGFKFEPEQTAEIDYKAAIERIVSKIRTAKNLPVADNDYIRGTDFGLTLALRIINEEIK